MPDPGWIQTYTGRAFFPLDPRLEDIDIADIAYGLAGEMRFGNHAKQRYTVAQHSVLVSEQVPVQYALRGLLHDASEAYLGDIPRPLKVLDLFKGYREVEGVLEERIFTRFNVDPHDWEGKDAVKIADVLLLGVEVRDLMQPLVRAEDWMWCLAGTANSNLRITDVWSMEEAEWRFLTRFHDLGGER